MIVFILNNKVINTNTKTGMTLLDFIRNEQELTGTKIGCREGDCGACTVLVGTLQDNGSVSYQSITSCISPLGNANGKHIVTVEGFNLLNKLNQVQSSMKEQNAAQCGFCSPGFVVSLTGFTLQENTFSPDDVHNAMSGNICRCTGYKSILRAADKIYKLLKKVDDKNRLHWLIENEFIPSYFSQIPNKLKKLKQDLKTDELKTLVAGGTDLYVQSADELVENDIDLSSNKENLKGIAFYQNRCVIAAGTTVTEIMRSSALQVYFPKLKPILKLVASEQIRNMATLAGNFVNASPIGDMTIFFLALNSKITLQNKSKKLRTIFLKKFYKSYKNVDLNKNEILVNVSFIVPNKKTKFNFEKVSKRTHLDIASVNSALSIKMTDKTIDDVHISFGGVAPIPKYVSETSLFLKDKILSKEIIIEASKILLNEIKPISDVRGTSTYKKLLAKQLLFAHFIKLFPNKFNLNSFV